MESRTIIEESLAGLAAERASDEEITAIGDAVQRMRDCIGRGESILEADMAFHLAIAAGAHNEVLRNSVQLLRNMTRQWLQYKVQMPNVAPNVLKHHVKIFTAIKARKPAAARAAMRVHLEETMTLVTLVVERYGKKQSE